MTTTIEGRGVYQRNSDVVSRQVGSESILVPIRHNVGDLDFVYTLSPVAARIWSLLDGERAVESIVDSLCTEFEVERDAALADAVALLEDLGAASLISQVK